MLLPPEYAWIGLVVLGGVIVFVADLIGNTLSFHNRFLNALTTALVFGAAFAFFIYFRYGTVTLTNWGFYVQQSSS